jgi:hypothetical protein
MPFATVMNNSVIYKIHTYQAMNIYVIFHIWTFLQKGKVSQSDNVLYNVLEVVINSFVLGLHKSL